MARALSMPCCGHPLLTILRKCAGGDKQGVKGVGLADKQAERMEVKRFVRGEGTKQGIDLAENSLMLFLGLFFSDREPRAEARQGFASFSRIHKFNRNTRANRQSSLITHSCMVWCRFSVHQVPRSIIVQ